MAGKSKYEKGSGYRANAGGFIYHPIEYAEKRRKEVEARDHIIAEGYAERQMAETLKQAGKIKTEL